MVASLNYERKFFSKRNNNFATVKVGIGPFAATNILNITATYNVGDGMNFFEFGGGGLVTYQLFNADQRNYVFPYFSPTLGYRRQSSKGFLFRAFLSTYLERKERYNYTYYNNNGYSYYGSRTSEIVYNYYPFLGISVGYSF